MGSAVAGGLLFITCIVLLILLLRRRRAQSTSDVDEKAPMAGVNRNFETESLLRHSSFSDSSYPSVINAPPRHHVSLGMSGRLPASNISVDGTTYELKDDSSSALAPTLLGRRLSHSSVSTTSNNTYVSTYMLPMSDYHLTAVRNPEDDFVRVFLALPLGCGIWFTFFRRRSRG